MSDTIKKLRSNQVEIEGKVYTKNIGAFLHNDIYRPKNEFKVDTYTNELKHFSILSKYLDPFTKKYAYTTKPVNLYINGNSIKVCKSYVNNDEFILLDYESSDSNIYISKFDKVILSTGKYQPERKIYSIKDYKFKNSKPLLSIDNKLSWINYTYGFELETSVGKVSENTSNELGFATLYDGSINGIEYVSKVFKPNNLHYLHKFLKVSNALTNIDRFCSLHIHIGNVPKSDRNLLSIYVLFQRLTDELNQLIAPYKKDINFLSEKLQKNGRDHCKNLPKLINNDVSEIYKLLKLNNIDNLEDYIHNTSKWNLQGRYYTVNFINYICKEESNTIEIRSLQSTYNFDYIITWLLINTAIIDYAINNQDRILNSKEKIELNDCLEHYIKDIEVLKILKSNIFNIKNIFYNYYYHNNNSLNDPFYIDKIIDNQILSYDIFNNNKDSIKYSNSFFKKYLNGN